MRDWSSKKRLHQQGTQRSHITDHLKEDISPQSPLAFLLLACTHDWNYNRLFAVQYCGHFKVPMAINQVDDRQLHEK